MSNNWDNWIKLYNDKWINTEKIDSNMYALHQSFKVNEAKISRTEKTEKATITKIRNPFLIIYRTNRKSVKILKI